MRALGEPIVMITAYDHPSALVVEEAGVDVVLVGDSAANNVLGYSDTVPVTVEELLMLTRAVRRGLKTPLLVGDLPVRVLRGVATRRRSRPRTASSRRRAATPSSSRAAAPPPSAPARSCAPACR